MYGSKKMRFFSSSKKFFSVYIEQVYVHFFSLLSIHALNSLLNIALTLYETTGMYVTR